MNYTKLCVEVVKPFTALRTPCPIAGTVGRVVNDPVINHKDGPMLKVAFWQFEGTDGYIWGPGQGDGSEPFVLHFKLDEIRLSTKKAPGKKRK